MSIKTKKKSLREIAKGLEEHKTSATPSELADRLMKEIPHDEQAHYLREALGALAITMLADFRRSTFKAVVNTSRGVGASSRIKVPKERVQTIIDPETLEESTVETPEFSKYKSFKSYQIKTEWEKFLDQNLPTETGYIKIADAGIEDLKRAAAIRRNQSAALEVEAVKYDNLVSVLILKDADKVGLLTAEDVKGML